MYWGYHYWGMHLFWWLFWLSIVVLLVATGWPRSRISVRDPALDALRTRYAAGEIDEEEYQERLAVLIGNRPRPARRDRRDAARPGSPGDRSGPTEAGRGTDGHDARS
ncbi:MAG TPA: SHOCT domain-containing protein [Kofleriaceae bacterium]|jgi:putative membrane protein|nr:SHOCT domain-containing protein [Kofleriaceae bacterium]